MRRPAVATMSTISGLVLVFSYHAGRAQSSAALEPGTAGAVQDEAPAAQDLAPAPEPSAGTAEEDDLDQGVTDDSDTDPEDGDPDDGKDENGTTSDARKQSAPATATPAPSATQGSSGGSAASRTYLGDAVNTHFGPVQVQITVAGGRITAAEVTQVPMGNGHDVRINSHAVPILNAAAVAQQSAEIDGVSGATITSGAYRQSLQSAIDAAGL